MLIEASVKGYLVFQSKQAYWSCALVTNVSCSVNLIWLCPCSGIAVVYCTCLLHYWGRCERDDFTVVVHVRWASAGNLTLVCLQAQPEGHCSNSQCSIQGQSSKILNTTMRWQWGIVSTRTMARAEQCILISLLLIFRFGEVLQSTGTVCAVFMVKACLCNTCTVSLALW